LDLDSIFLDLAFLNLFNYICHAMIREERVRVLLEELEEEKNRILHILNVTLDKETMNYNLDLLKGVKSNIEVVKFILDEV